MQLQEHISSNTMKNYGSRVTTQNDKSPATILKESKYCHLTDKKFKIAILEKFNELHENSKRQLSELRNKIINKRSTLDCDSKMNQTEILELKISLNELKKALESIGNRAYQMEEIISNLKDKNLEMFQVEE